MEGWARALTLSPKSKASLAHIHHSHTSREHGHRLVGLMDGGLPGVHVIVQKMSDLKGQSDQTSVLTWPPEKDVGGPRPQC